MNNTLKMDTFERRELAGKHVIVRRDGADTIFEALTTASNCRSIDAIGRGNLRQFDWKPDRSGVVRQHHRGGFASHFLKDSYLFHNRPCQEFLIHHAVEELGLPVPQLLGVVWERHAVAFRGALATEFLDGPDLLTWLQKNGSSEPESSCGKTLRKVGALIRTMHRSGIWHADLQAKNLLVIKDIPHVIDLDQSRVGKPVSAIQRNRNLLRFRRSLEKSRFPDEFFELVMSGYDESGTISVPVWLEKAYRLRGHFSDLVNGGKNRA